MRVLSIIYGVLSQILLELLMPFAPTRTMFIRLDWIVFFTEEGKNVMVFILNSLGSYDEKAGSSKTDETLITLRSITSLAIRLQRYCR